MRAYITPETVNSVIERVATTGLASARKVARPGGPAFPEALTPGTEYADEGREGNWRKVLLQYPLWYGDYGGLARIRFFAMPVEGQTLVLVFMGGDKAEIDQIVSSVRIA
jgi:hypothetical protein